MSRPSATSVELESALDTLIAALETFQAAFARWAEYDGARPAEVAALLADAERRVDEARVALADLQRHLDP